MLEHMQGFGAETGLMVNRPAFPWATGACCQVFEWLRERGKKPIKSRQAEMEGNATRMPARKDFDGPAGLWKVGQHSVPR